MMRDDADEALTRRRIHAEQLEALSDEADVRRRQRAEELARAERSEVAMREMAEALDMALDGIAKARARLRASSGAGSPMAKRIEGALDRAEVDLVDVPLPFRRPR